MRATRVIIEVRDRDGEWFRVFQIPHDKAGDIILHNDAAGRLADVVQRRIAEEIIRTG